MVRLLSYAAFALAFAVLSWGSASAAPQNKTVVGDGSYQVADSWNDRICCKRGNSDFWTTRRRCDRWGGHQVRNWQCRDDWNDRWDERWWQWGNDWDRRICCKRGNRDWWTTARDCRNSFGYETNRRECREDEWRENWDRRWRNWEGDWDRRICCQRGDRDWWSTPRDCRERGGWMVRDRECRQDEWNENWDRRWRNWEGNWDERVCCQKGDRDWWSTRRDCRDRGGWAVRREECRDRDDD